MMYDRYDYGSGDGFAWIFMLLMMALMFLGVVLVVHYLHRSTHNISKEDTALEILKSRYAKGEMEKKEFDEKRKDLKG
jgi:putative membrane protein